MKVKTYKTHSLHEGLEDIKRDLGGEALILSTRSVSARTPFGLFKKPVWEITAALEEKAAAEPTPSPAVPSRNNRGLSLHGETPLALGEPSAREAQLPQRLHWRLRLFPRQRPPAIRAWTN